MTSASAPINATPMTMMTMAYSTPVVCTGYGSLAELDSAHGVLNVSPRGEGDDAVATGLAEGIESRSVRAAMVR